LRVQSEQQWEERLREQRELGKEGISVEKEELKGKEGEENKKDNRKDEKGEINEEEEKEEDLNEDSDETLERQEKHIEEVKRNEKQKDMAARLKKAVKKVNLIVGKVSNEHEKGSANLAPKDIKAVSYIETLMKNIAVGPKQIAAHRNSLTSLVPTEGKISSEHKRGSASLAPVDTQSAN
jgi:hypothetical protein